MPTGWTHDPSTFPSVFSLSIGANEDGRLEIYAIDDNGVLWHKYQIWDATQRTVAGWSGWVDLGQSQDADYEQAINYGLYDIFPALTAIGGECIEVLTQPAYGIQQLAANGNWPNYLSNLGADAPGITGIGRNVNGALYAFGVHQNGSELYYGTQPNAGSDWAWKKIPFPEVLLRKIEPLPRGSVIQLADWNFRSHLARTTSPNLASGCNEDGRLEVFFPTLQHVYHRWETAPGSDVWSGWTALPAFPGYSQNGNLLVIQNGAHPTPGYGYRLEIFALSNYQSITAPCTLYHCWQAVANGNWDNWQPIPGLDINGIGGVWTKGPFTIARQQDGSLVVFAVGRLTPTSDQSVCYIQQDGPSAAFRKHWVDLGGGPGIRNLEVGQSIDGTLLIAITAAEGSVWHRQQLAINSDNWSS